MGADSVDHDARIQGLLSLLERVPKIQLLVLDALLSHLNDLIESTEEATETLSTTASGEEKQAKPAETDAEYMAKLGATIGPCVLRPAIESSKTFNDRFPSQLFVDLLKNYSVLIPTTLERKSKVEEERYAPKRQRTKMVDQRLTRSTTAAKVNKRHSDWLKEELERKMGHKIMEEPEDMPVQQEAENSHAKLVKSEIPALPSKDGQNIETNNSDRAEKMDEKEELQIPPVPEIIRPTSSSSEEDREIGGKSSGFVTPTEEMADSGSTAALSPRTDASSLEDVDTKPATSTISSIKTGALDKIASPENDDDKPLASSASLLRSSTGSSARRNPLSRSGATRGPRPMSMHGPPSSAGGSTGSASSAAGVRARAAMFEQRNAASPK